jgi:hypothetical protein
MECFYALSQETREIRIVTLLPSADPSMPIQCTLRKGSLNNPPWYLALSYAWGDVAITAPIFLNDTEIQVTTNLEAALRHMRVTVSVNLWIDAICINQADPGERGQQIQLMREIYSQAKKVLVWLGKEQDDSSLALRTMHRLVLDHLKGGAKHEPTLDAINRLDDSAANAIKHLFQRSWWSRLWTVQEVVLAKEIEVICGETMLPWVFFTSWSNILVARTDPSTWTVEKNDFLKIVFLEGSWEVFTKAFLRMIYEKHEIQDFPLRELVGDLCIGMKCTDPQDRIYGIMGLAVDAEDFGPPDYSLSVSALYIRSAVTMIDLRKDLTTLHYATPRPLLAADKEEVLPSWVPDWTPQTYPKALNLKYYSATKGRKALVRLDLSPSPVVHAKGVLWDKISGLADVDTKGNENPDWEYLIYKDRSRIYSTGVTQLQAFFRTILLDENIFLKTRLSSTDDSFFDLAAPFVGYLLMFSYPPLSDLSTWKAQLLLVPKDSQDPWKFDLFLGDAKCQTSLKWPGEATYQSVIRACTQHLKALMATIVHKTRERKFFVTNGGYMGSGFKLIENGDLVCVFPGCKVPVRLASTMSFEGNALYLA